MIRALCPWCAGAPRPAVGQACANPACRVKLVAQTGQVGTWLAAAKLENDNVRKVGT